MAVYPLMEVPHQIINKLIIPMDMGLFIVFSLSFLLLQVMISVGINYIQIKSQEGKKDKDSEMWCKQLFEIVELNCWKLIKKNKEVWGCCLYSILFVTMYYVSYFLVTLIADSALKLVAQTALLFFIFFIIFLNIAIIIKILKIGIVRNYMAPIREALNGIVYGKTPRRRYGLPPRPLEEEIKRLTEQISHRNNVAPHFNP